MWRSGGVKSESTPPAPAAPKLRVRVAFRILIAIAGLGAAVFFIFPAAFNPRVDVPTKLPFASPSSVMVQISNLNLTPLLHLEYSCDVSQVTLANGSQPADAKVLMRGSILKLGGRHAMAARCETAYLVTDPVKKIEYKLTVRYQAYPWPKQRTDVYRISAQIDGRGQVTGWKLD